MEVPYDWEENGYLLLNSDGSGFYRTFYNTSATYFDALVAKLSTDTLSVCLFYCIIFIY